MVKFGRQLAANRVKDWEEHYVNYGCVRAERGVASKAALHLASSTGTLRVTTVTLNVCACAWRCRPATDG